MPKLIHITGGGAVGKTTVCASLRKRLPSYCFVSIASLRPMLRPGLSAEAEGTVARGVLVSMIREVMAHGADILTEEFTSVWLRRAIGADLTRRDYTMFSVFLMCNSRVALRRHLQRTVRGCLKRPSLTKLRELLRWHRQQQPSEGDLIIDTSNQSVRETAVQIIRFAASVNS